MAAQKRPEKLVRQVQVCELPEAPEEMLAEEGMLDTIALERLYVDQDLETLEELIGGPRNGWLDQIT